MIKTKEKIDKRKTDMRNVQDNTGCGEIFARESLHQCKGYVDLAIAYIGSYRRPWSTITLHDSQAAIELMHGASGISIGCAGIDEKP